MRDVRLCGGNLRLVAQVLPEELRPRVFSTRTPQSVPTFLVDGRVAGTWRYARGRVKVEPFRKLSKTERLAAFHA
jgi:hypothetical protein